MAIPRLSVKLGKRGKGGAHADYITRNGAYAIKHEQSEKLEAIESGNMPGFAVANPRALFEASDAHERANAKYSYREMELALPRELTPEQRVELMNEWCQQELPNYPYLYAIHNPIASDGGEQPHAHLMFVERENDGIERDEKKFFMRANRKNPERGGALKTYNLPASGAEREDKLLALRQRWQEHVNEHLARAHVDASIDMRSYRDQGIDKTAQIKMLPSQSRRRAALMSEARVYEYSANQQLADVREQATAYLHAKKAEIDEKKAEAAKRAAKAEEAKKAREAAEAAKKADPLQSPSVINKTAEIEAQKRETASAKRLAATAEEKRFNTELDLNSAKLEHTFAQRKARDADQAVSEAREKLEGIKGLFKSKARKAASAELEQAQAHYQSASSAVLDTDAERRALEHQHQEQRKAAQAAQAKAGKEEQALAGLEKQRSRMIDAFNRPAPDPTNAWALEPEQERPRDAWSDAEDAARRDRSHSNDGPELG